MSSVAVKAKADSRDYIQFKIPKPKYRNIKAKPRKHYPAWQLESDPVKYPKDAVRIHPRWRSKGRLIDQVRSMIEGRWLTLHEISKSTGGSECSVSAQMRALRHPANGSYPVIRRYVGMTSHGFIYEYTIPQF